MLAFGHVLEERQPPKFSAGMLVLDHSGDPREFRCTSPLQPTPLQQILWGQRLQRYVLCELLLLPLVESLQLQVELVLVQREEFLAARPKMSQPLLLITRDGGTPSAGRQQNHVTIKMPSSDGSGQLIFLQCLPGYEEDLEIGRQLITRFLETCYPLEPFQRIELALKTLKPKLEASSKNS